jgi:YggT family protein
MISILFDLILMLIGIAKWLLIAQIIYSWLVAFNVLDTRNRVVWSIGDFLYRVTEPALRPIRRFMPNLGPVDLSPLALFLLFWVMEQVVVRLHYAIALGDFSILIR